MDVVAIIIFGVFVVAFVVLGVMITRPIDENE